jgi:hypothetical protein
MYTYVPGYKGRIYMADNAILPKTKKAITKSEFMAKVQKYTRAVYLSRSYYEMIKAVETFTKHCPLVKTLAKAAAWKNAFKGTGAYYTMDNMIKFHGCKFTVEDNNGNKTTLDMDKSLRYLEMKTADYQNEYYRLYALMRKFIEDNNFTYSDTPVDEYELKNYG